MWYHQKKDMHVGVGQPFEIDGIQYPANWLQLASEAEIEAIGLVPVSTVGERKDDRYYDNSETLNGAVLTITAIRKDAATIAAIKWGDIKAERDSRKGGGFKVNVGGVDRWFHSDADSRIRHLGLKDKARDLLVAGGAMPDNIIILGQPVLWKTMDGSFVGVTAQVAFDIVIAAGELDAKLFSVAETHKAAMEASANPVEYDFSTGWPLIYGEV